MPNATAGELRASLVENIRNVLALGITSFTLAGTSPGGMRMEAHLSRARARAAARDGTDPVDGAAQDATTSRPGRRGIAE